MNNRGFTYIIGDSTSGDVSHPTVSMKVYLGSKMGLDLNKYSYYKRIPKKTNGMPYRVFNVAILKGVLPRWWSSCTSWISESSNRRA